VNPFDPAPEGHRPAADVRGLTLVRIVDLGWYVITGVIFVVLPKLGVIDDLMLIFQVTSAVGLLIGMATIGVMVPFVRSLAGQTAEGMAKVALIVACVSLLLDLPQTIGAFNGDFVVSLNQALLVTGEVCLWLAITRIQPGTRHGGAFYALLGANVAIVLLRLVLPRETLTTGAVGAVLPWARIAIGIARQIIVILALRGLHGLVAGGPVPPPRTTEGQRDALIGGLWLTGGLLVTFGSMAATSGGNGYVVTFGAIIYGAFRLIRGLSR